MRKTLWIIPLPTLRATTIRPVVMQVLKKSAVASQNLTQPLTKLSPTTKASNHRFPSPPDKLSVLPARQPRHPPSLPLRTNLKGQHQMLSTFTMRNSPEIRQSQRRDTV
jgi:hypothetical protein